MPASRRANLVMLVAGFGLGQGSLFVAQTWLVARGQAAFIGLYGLCFSYLILALYVVDWGGLVVLAREDLQDGAVSGRTERFWSLSWLRFALALLMLLAILALSPRFLGPFYTTYLLAAWPGLACFAFNAGGHLDGLKMSGATGLTSAVPYVATALALGLLDLAGPDGMGWILGSAFSAGVIVQCLGQHAVLARTGAGLGKPVWNWRTGRSLAVSGALYLATWLPSQLLFRIQITVAAYFFGAAGGGLVIYAKQVLNVALQFLFFIRRAEFPGLVDFLREPRNAAEVTRIQWRSHAAALAGCAGLIALGITGRLVPIGSFSEAGILMIAFAPVVVTSNFYSNFNQVAFARGAYRRSSLAAGLLLPLGAVLYPATAATGSVTLFALAETAIAISGTLLLWLMLRQSGEITK